MKEKSQKIEEIKQKLKELKEKRAKGKSARKLIEPPTPPRYDEIFWKGTEWLDSL